LAVLAYISHHRDWAILHICPKVDGNNCVPRVSNIGLLLSRGEFQLAMSRLIREANNFLSVLHFSIFSAILGPGRSAWTTGWIVALGAFLGCSTYALKSKFSAGQTIFTFLLFLSCSSLLSPAGGLLDERFDLFSVFFIFSTANCILTQRLILALYFSIFAVYAKGPAIPVLIILWFFAFVARIVSPSQVFAEFKRSKVALIPCFLLLILYKIYFLKTVVFYNLAAISGQDRPLLVIIKEFVSSSILNIIHSHWFYLKSLYARAPFFLLLLGIGVISIFQTNQASQSKEDENASSQRRIALWGLLTFLFTCLLFSTHPVRSKVLDLWLQPGIWILALCANLYVQRIQVPRVLILLLISVQLAFSLKSMKEVGPHQNAEYQKYWKPMVVQAKSLAEVLQQRPQLSKLTVRILPNFLKSPVDEYFFSYDTYRVLLFETLGRNSPILEGWELGTRGDQWESELEGFARDHEAFLGLIVTEGSDAIHFRQVANKLANEYVKVVNPTCELKNVQEPTIPGFGKFRFFFTERGLTQCL
jgi:hypothetical protein